MTSASWIPPFSKYYYTTRVSVANNRLTQLTQSVFEPILNYFVENNFATDKSAIIEIQMSKFNQRKNRIVIV